MTAHTTQRRPDAAKVLNALAQPLLTVDVQGMVIDVNAAAETFFDMGRGTLLRSSLTDLFPSDSPILALVADALSNRATVNGYKIDVSTPRIGSRDVDVFVAPLVADGQFRGDYAARKGNCRKDRQTADASQRRTLN